MAAYKTCRVQCMCNGYSTKGAWGLIVATYYLPNLSLQIWFQSSWEDINLRERKQRSV